MNQKENENKTLEYLIGTSDEIKRFNKKLYQSNTEEQIVLSIEYNLGLKTRLRCVIDKIKLALTNGNDDEKNSLFNAAIRACYGREWKSTEAEIERAAGYD